MEEWRSLVAEYFPAAMVDDALSIIECESHGDPLATNSYSGAAGLFQFVPGTWRWVTNEMGAAGSSPYDPAGNVAAAWWLVSWSIEHEHSGGPWGHWTCRP